MVGNAMESLFVDIKIEIIFILNIHKFIYFDS